MAHNFDPASAASSSAVNTPSYSDDLWGRGTPCPYDGVVDVRSPAEFAEDNIPGSVNLPVLSDAERVEVGTIYCRVGTFAARKIGAAYVSANIARHLREHFAGKEKDYRPFVYCWRGGQRSASLALVLAQVGWRVTVLRGGYKTYRKFVRRELDAALPQFEYRIVAGATGTGKTRLLHALAARGAQVLDLEKLAGHRGSVLGGGGTQPTQKYFDSLLLAAVDRFAPGAPIWVEAESNRIGNVYLPPALWAKMRAARGVEVQLSAEGRVHLLLAEYSNLIAEPGELREKLRRLTPLHGPRQIEAWCRLTEVGAWGELVASLLAVHYDPAYAKSTRHCYPLVGQKVTLESPTAAAIDELAATLHPSATS